MRPRHLYVLGFVSLVLGFAGMLISVPFASLAVMAGVLLWIAAFVWLQVHQGNRMADLDDAIHKCYSGEPMQPQTHTTAKPRQ